MFAVETRTKTMDSKHRVNLGDFAENLDVDNNNKVCMQSTNGIVVIENQNHVVKLLDLLHTLCILNKLIKDDVNFCEQMRKILKLFEDEVDYK